MIFQICKNHSIAGIELKTKPAKVKYPEARLQCFVGRKLVNLKSNSSLEVYRLNPALRVAEKRWQQHYKTRKNLPYYDNYFIM